jgi:hypothetical protein
MPRSGETAGDPFRFRPVYGIFETLTKENPVRICWKNRSAASPAVVIAGSKHVLPGAIPLEMMDLIANPVKMRLEGARGNRIEFLAL